MDLEGVPVIEIIEDDGDKLFNELCLTIDELQPSVIYIVLLRVRLAFDDVKTAFPAGDVAATADFRGVLSFIGQGVRATGASPCIDAARVVPFSEVDDALWRGLCCSG